MEEGIRLGKKLRTLRHVHNYTQKFVADSLGISPNTLSRWEKDEISPTLEDIRKTSAFYKVSLEWMLNPDSFVLNMHDNEVANGAYHLDLTQHNTVPREFMERITTQYDEHIKALHKLTDRVLDLLDERKEKGK